MMHTTFKDDFLIRSGSRFRDLFRIMVYPEKNFPKLIIIYTAAICILNLIIPVAIQMVINNIGARHLAQPIIILSLLLLFMLTFSGIFQILNNYLVEMLKRRLTIRFGAIIVERISRYKDEVYQQINTPDLINRFFDVFVAQTSMVVFFADGSAFILQALIGFTLLAFYHPFFLGFTVFTIGLLIFSWIYTGPKGVDAGSPEANGKYNLVSWMEDVGRARYLFMSKSARNFALNKYTKLVDEWLVVRENLFKCQIRQSAILQFTNAITYSLLISVGGMLVLKHELTAGQLVAASVVVAIIFTNLSRLQNFFTSIYDFSTSLDKIAQFYDYPIEKDVDNGVKIEKFGIEIKNVFEKPNFSFDFAIKERTRNLMIVKSFSAKNVLLKILYGNIEIKKGDYYIGGINVIDIGYNNLRDSMIIIKDGRYFNGTIKENLTAFTDKQFTYTQIEEALEKVGLKENIMNLPLKLDTMIGPTGHPLTNSQLLALQFAKALLEVPKILIVTTDFEKISTAKRKKIFPLITSSSAPWTLIFFSQRIYPKDPFDNFFHVNRSNVYPYENYLSLLKDLATHELY